MAAWLLAWQLLWLRLLQQLLPVRGPVNTLARQTDLAFVDVDSQDLDFDLVANFDHFFWVLDLVIGQFRNVQQAFEAIFQVRRRHRSW